MTASAILVLCDGHICHPSLFLWSCETVQMQRVGFATVHLNCKMWYIMWHLSVSLVQCCVFAQSSRGWQADSCTDKISFVEHSNRGRVVPLPTAWGHLLARTLLLTLLCLSVSVSVRQWSDWFSSGCLSVCRISLLSQVLYSACLSHALLPNSCR